VARLSWKPPYAHDQPLERCHGHVYRADERPYRSKVELEDGPLCVASILVDGRCRECREEGLRSQRERERVAASRALEPAPDPTPTLFESEPDDDPWADTRTGRRLRWQSSTRR
jgi:hypothetical protein